MKITGERVLVVGMGKSGVAAAEFLLARRAKVSATDKRPLAELDPAVAALERQGVRLRVGDHQQSDFTSAERIILSPGVPTTLPQLEAARAAGVPIWSEIELAYRFLRGKIVGVTGTAGKSTTASLIGHLLRTAGRRAQVVGNIGAPAIEWAPRSRSQDVTVIELSSFQLETIERFRPHVALWLNLSPHHLDRYRSVSEYAAAKRRLLINQKASDWAVLPAADRQVRRAARGMRARKLYFGARHRGSGAALRDGWITVQRGKRVYRIAPAREFPLLGSHNLENALAAVAAAQLLGASKEALRQGLKTFRGLEHRLEPVGALREIRLVNDSKATSVAAAALDLRCFPKDVLWIAGGCDEGADLRPLVAAARRRVKRAFLIGQSAPRFKRALAPAVACEIAGDLRTAVERALSGGAPGDVLLLAPACASYDQFLNFEERGRLFKQYLRARGASAVSSVAPEVSHGG
jgi:UDP-N-acetylmuramoylalanine--D-glutamate ligase